MNAKRKWYREPWPWLLMSGPAAVIVAGGVTSVLAFSSSDGLVADDYYRQGLAINRAIARDTAARALGIRGTVTFGEGRVTARLDADRPIGERIRVSLVHGARAGEDRIASLTREAGGTYGAAFPAVPPGRWTVVLETAEWRLEAPADLRAGPSVNVSAR